MGCRAPRIFAVKFGPIVAAPDLTAVTDVLHVLDRRASVADLRATRVQIEVLQELVVGLLPASPSLPGSWAESFNFLMFSKNFWASSLVQPRRLSKSDSAVLVF